MVRLRGNPDSPTVLSHQAVLRSTGWQGPSATMTRNDFDFRAPAMKPAWGVENLHVLRKNKLAPPEPPEPKGATFLASDLLKPKVSVTLQPAAATHCQCHVPAPLMRPCVCGWLRCRARGCVAAPVAIVGSC